MDFTIRKMVYEDISAVASIERECFTEPWSEKSFADELENPQATVIVAEIDGVVAAFADIREVFGEVYINNIAVSEPFRRAGIGDALMKELLNCVSDEAEFISLEVRSKNAEAISLYKKHGYIQVGLRKNFYRQPDDDAVLMTKLLK